MAKPKSSPHLNVGDLVKLTPDLNGRRIVLDGEDAVGIITKRWPPGTRASGPSFDLVWLINTPVGRNQEWPEVHYQWLRHHDQP